MKILGNILGAAAVIALLAGPAYAQTAPVPRYGDVDKDKTPQEKEAAKEAERAYQRSLGNIPEQKSGDPWGAVRSDNAPKAAAKTTAKTSAPKPKAKTDSAAKQ
jgi:hypothetical protein